MNKGLKELITAITEQKTKEVLIKLAKPAVIDKISSV